MQIFFGKYTSLIKDENVRERKQRDQGLQKYIDNHKDGNINETKRQTGQI